MAAGTRDFTAGTLTARPASYTLNPFLIKQKIDLADVVKLKGSALEADEIIQAIKVPAGTFVQRVLVKVVTAATGTALTANVGDGDSATGYDAEINLKATAGTITTSTNAFTLAEGTPNVITVTDAYNAGKAYTAEDTIDVKLATVTDVTAWPVIEVTAVCYQL